MSGTSGMRKIRAVMLVAAVVAAGLVADGGQADASAHVALTRNRCAAYEQAARNVGWAPREAAVVVRVAWRETGGTCDPRAYNGRHRDQSYGLVQINTKGYLWAGVLAECGAIVKRKTDLFNPNINLWCAKQLRDRYGMWMLWRVRV